MDSCDSVGRSKICDVRRCKKECGCLRKSDRHILYCCAPFYTSHQRDPCNHNEAMYFYAHFRRKGGHNEKSINPEKDYVKELIKIIRVTKR